MPRSTFIFFIIGLLLLSGISAISFSLPTTVQAGPLAGFTPSPGDNGGDHDNGEPPKDEPGRTPTDYIMVQLEQCDLICAAGTAGSQPAYQPLAQRSPDQAELPPLVPIAKAEPVEVQAPVRLVHEGSGFITEGVLSTQHSNRLVVPYPGRWELFLTGQPQFITAEAVDVSGTNLAELQSQVASGPISLGQVEANTAEPQRVRCPIACVIEPPAAVPAEVGPPTLPETGGEQPESNLRLLLILQCAFIVLTTGTGLARAAAVVNRL
ncbi:MAG TPA: hypothetical protein PKE64_02815 [Anaerolineae bacterium]|nr:hypothetical protein [Anaerolineae bacterium]